MPEAAQILSAGCSGPHFGQFPVMLWDLSMVKAAERLLDQVRQCFLLRSRFKKCLAFCLLKFLDAQFRRGVPPLDNSAQRLDGVESSSPIAL